MEKIIIWLEKIQPKKRYTYLGFFFGLIFPVAGTIIEASLASKAIWPSNF